MRAGYGPATPRVESWCTQSNRAIAAAAYLFSFSIFGPTKDNPPRHPFPLRRASTFPVHMPSRTFISLTDDVGGRRWSARAGPWSFRGIRRTTGSGTERERGGAGGRGSFLKLYCGSRPPAGTSFTPSARLGRSRVGSRVRLAEPAGTPRLSSFGEPAFDMAAVRVQVARDDVDTFSGRSDAVNCGTDKVCENQSTFWRVVRDRRTEVHTRLRGYRQRRWIFSSSSLT